MLHDFLNAHRDELIARCRAKVAARAAVKPAPASADPEHGIPLFLEQLIQALRVEHAADSPRPRFGTGDVRSNVRPLRRRAAPADTCEINVSGMQHGLELAQQGFTIDQVVHVYGDLCQAVTELATELRAPIEVVEFKTLNRCLDDAIAGAVSEFCFQRDDAAHDRNSQVTDGRTRALLQQLQTHVQTAALAVSAVKTGNVGLQGATGAILGISLVSMRTLIERALASAPESTRLLARV